MKVVSTEALTKLIQLVKSAFIKVDDVVEVTEIETETPSEITLATVATSGSYNDLLNKPDLSTKADVDLSNINTAGKSFASGLGMPSSRYIDLTLGASGSTYTAPANGWFWIKKAANGNNQFISLQTPKIQLDSDTTSSGNYIGLAMPVSKGDVLTIYYNLGGSTAAFRFIYAEGENV